MSVEDEKRIAAEAAAAYVEDGMRVGLGTGSTVAHLLPSLARRGVTATFVATSPRTEQAAKALGLVVEPFDTLDRLDLAIDGADQVTTGGWLIKGGGGAHTREKIVAAATDRFIVIADSTKLVDQLHTPVPLELLAFGLASTLHRLQPTRIRAGAISPDGGVIADFLGEINDPSELAHRLSASPGVIEHGLFAPSLVSEILIGTGEAVRRLIIGETR
ncbi:MAG TPA: ribose-5-phosphate isomerase RpiA [Candidatus Nanopelagicaceae bacterium]|nr:ribose-5-phosphate isomerase RpiA [Candidatus Nanopelagicaceae bacterium]